MDEKLLNEIGVILESLADFTSGGGFPAFWKKEDAEIALNLVDDEYKVGHNYFICLGITRSGIGFYYID